MTLHRPLSRGFLALALALALATVACTDGDEPGASVPAAPTPSSDGLVSEDAGATSKRVAPAEEASIAPMLAAKNACPVPVAAAAPDGSARAMGAEASGGAAGAGWGSSTAFPSGPAGVRGW